VFNWLKKALTKRRMRPTEDSRRVTIEEEVPSDRFVVIIVLMIVFFAGLIALQIVYLLVMKEWNDLVFNGIMLIVGSLLGSLFGYQES
jgi:hypothetical protein